MISTKIGGGEISEAEKMRRERARVGGSKGIVEYEWAPDGKSVLAPVDGDLYLADVGTGAIRRLTNTPATEIDAHVSEGGRYVSFVRDQNLYAIDLTTGAERSLTREGKDNVTCGTAEFVAQEEMDRHTGTWWSPGDGRVAVECYDESKVEVVTRAAIGANGTRVFDQRYPAAGTPNAVVTLWLIDPTSGRRSKVDLGTNPDIYLARVDWAKDGRALYVQRESRDQKRLDMLAVDPASGASRNLFTETAKTWVNLNDDFKPLKDGSLIWGSKRSGFHHLYRYASGQWTPVTHGDWSMTSLVGVDEANHRLFFTGNKDGALESHVYSVDYLRPGEPRRLTEAGYWNGAEMDKAGTRLLVNRSSPAQPPQVYLADSSGKRIEWVEQNALDASHPYAPFLAAHRPVKFGTLTASDGSLLNWEMITPPLAKGQQIPGLLRTLWRTRLAAGEAQLDEPDGPILGQQGLDLFPGRQSRLAQPRPRLRGPDLPCDGDGRGRGSGHGRALAAETALCRCREDRDLRLVVRRVHDAQDAREGAEGTIRRRALRALR